MPAAAPLADPSHAPRGHIDKPGDATAPNRLNATRLSVPAGRVGKNVDDLRSCCQARSNLLEFIPEESRFHRSPTVA